MWTCIHDAACYTRPKDFCFRGGESKPSGSVMQTFVSFSSPLHTISGHVPRIHLARNVHNKSYPIQVARRPAVGRHSPPSPLRSRFEKRFRGLQIQLRSHSPVVYGVGPGPSALLFSGRMVSKGVWSSEYSLTEASQMERQWAWCAGLARIAPQPTTARDMQKGNMKVTFRPGCSNATARASLRAQRWGREWEKTKGGARRRSGQGPSHKRTCASSCRVDVTLHMHTPRSLPSHGVGYSFQFRSRVVAYTTKSDHHTHLPLRFRCTPAGPGKARTAAPCLQGACPCEGS